MVTISSLLFYTHHQFFLDHLLHLHLLRFRIFRAVFLISSVVVSVHSFRFRCRQIVSIDPFEPFHWWNLNIVLVAVRQLMMPHTRARLLSSAILLDAIRCGTHVVPLCSIADRRFGMYATQDRRLHQLGLLRWHQENKQERKRDKKKIINFSWRNSVEKCESLMSDGSSNNKNSLISWVAALFNFIYFFSRWPESHFSWTLYCVIKKFAFVFVWAIHLERARKISVEHTCSQQTRKKREKH